MPLLSAGRGNREDVRAGAGIAQQDRRAQHMSSHGSRRGP